jgi:hypothetical protein
MHINGGCHCGNITYETEINLDDVIICHCTDCQIISGAAYRTVAFTNEGDFTLKSGELKTYIKTAESGKKREQNFCPECGSHIYAATPGETSRKLGLRVGTINQRDALIPKAQYWCENAQSWVDNLKDIKKVDKQ